MKALAARLFGRAFAVATPRPAVPRALPSVVVDGRSVAVEVRANPRARRLLLRADAVRQCVRVTVPPRTGRAAAAAFVAANEGWIAARVARWPAPTAFAPGAVVPFAGGTLTIDWAAANPRGVARDGGRLVCGGDAATLPGRVTRWLKAQALGVLDAETRALAATIGEAVAQISVRDPAARWGSCAPGGRIAYSWRLILAPPEMRRSVVAHEVAHLVHPNHGAAFWRLAADLNGGDPLPQRRWLARHHATLHAIGRT